MNDKIITIGIGVYIRNKSFIKVTLDTIIQNCSIYNYFDKVKVMIVNDYQQQVQDFKIAQQYKQKYPQLFQLLDNGQNKGIAYTYNRMVNQCNTKYFMAFDSDDFFGRFNIIEQCEFLDKNTNFVGSYGIRRLCDLQNKFLYDCMIGSSYNLLDFINFNCVVTHNGLILRVSDAFQTGNYFGNYLVQSNVKIDVSSDYSMFVAMLLKGDLAYRNQIRCLYNEYDHCYHKEKVHLFIEQFENIAKCVIKYCQNHNFKYSNMKLLYESAKRFLQNQQFYINNSWITPYIKQ